MGIKKTKLKFLTNYRPVNRVWISFYFMKRSRGGFQFLSEESSASDDGSVSSSSRSVKTKLEQLQADRFAWVSKIKKLKATLDEEGANLRKTSESLANLARDVKTAKTTRSLVEKALEAQDIGRRFQDFFFLFSISLLKAEAGKYDALALLSTREVEIKAHAAKIEHLEHKIEILEKKIESDQCSHEAAVQHYKDLLDGAEKDHEMELFKVQQDYQIERSKFSGLTEALAVTKEDVVQKTAQLKRLFEDLEREKQARKDEEQELQKAMQSQKLQTDAKIQQLENHVEFLFNENERLKCKAKEKQELLDCISLTMQRCFSPRK